MALAPTSSEKEVKSDDQPVSVSCAVIVNQESGTVSEIWDDTFEAEFVKTLESNGWAPDLYKIGGDEIESTVQHAIKKDYKAILAAGGDGTTTSIAHLLSGKNIPLGILPFGTLNLAARDLGTPLDPIEAAKSLKPHHTREIDILEANGKTCLCLTIIGVYPEILHRAPEFHGRMWWMKFWKLGKLLATAYFRSPRFRVQITDESGKLRKVATRFIIIVPGEFEDEMGIIPRRDRLATGRCHIYVSKHQSRWANLKMVLRFLTGTRKEDPEMLDDNAASLSISIPHRKTVKVSVDGEISDLRLPAQFNLMRLELRVLNPQAAEES